MTRKFGEERIGERYGKLTIIGYDHMGRYRSYYKCSCDCGKECVVAIQNLTGGKTKSCGCLRGRHKRENPTQKKNPITEKCAAWLIKHYKHTKNDDIMDKWGISHSQLHRFAREKGLTKSSQFMKKAQANTTRAAHESHLRNGTYPPKGYIIPKSREYGFKPGETSLMRLGKKREAERIAKSGESLRKTRADEQLRVRWGLPQKTKLNVKSQPRKKTYQRLYLRRRGYIIERGSNIAYYDENTRRSPTFEARRRGDKNYFYFDFKPLEK